MLGPYMLRQINNRAMLQQHRNQTAVAQLRSQLYRPATRHIHPALCKPGHKLTVFEHEAVQVMVARMASAPCESSSCTIFASPR